MCHKCNELVELYRIKKALQEERVNANSVGKAGIDIALEDLNKEIETYVAVNLHP